VTTLPSRLQDILADPSLNQLSQQLFSNIFQNMLMNTTDAPPNIVNGSADASFNIQSLFGSGSESFINSIDITYTIDYDGSSNATIE
jgi:conjugal transfer/entry exclusion protein